MYSTDSDQHCLKCVFSSNMHLIDRCIEDVGTFLQGGDHCVSVTQTGLAIRELLLNAVEHGNKNDPEKRTHCIVNRIDNNRIQVKVEDEGDGFDFSRIDFTKKVDSDATRNRGLSIINTIADTIDFGNKGNEITITVTLPIETIVEVKQSADRFIITPQGDLLSSGSIHLRQQMNRCIENKPAFITFDFSHVERIDSICLSLFVLLARSSTSGSAKTVLEIVNARNEIQNLFWLTRLTDMYIFLTVPEHQEVKS